MNLFDKLVEEALDNKPELAPLRFVVEKELLHHEILRVLQENGFLSSLTFIGGTCLRDCYGSARLSEHLDFTGGPDFSRKGFVRMGALLVESIEKKYGFSVVVSEPVEDISNVDTWKVRVETRPRSKNLPAQRINIDVCAVPSYEKQPMMLLNPYGVDMGTTGLILQVESREEIFADKLLSFALRPNRIKYRDVWDMVWLHEQGIRPRFELVPRKLIEDRGREVSMFLNAFEERVAALGQSVIAQEEYVQEMRRFLPGVSVEAGVKNEAFWRFALYLLNDLAAQLRRELP